jgi:hypothetical protein
MFFDEALLPAIKRIGTLGLHEALVSDHVMLYVDLNKKELFQGLISIAQFVFQVQNSF